MMKLNVGVKYRDGEVHNASLHTDEALNVMRDVIFRAALGEIVAVHITRDEPSKETKRYCTVCAVEVESEDTYLCPMHEAELQLELSNQED